jgi:hypothetical protein
MPQLHPFSPSPYTLNASAHWTNGQLNLAFDLQGDLQRLVIPPPSDSVRRDELWKHTCFEAFLQPHGSTSYYEFNVSSSSSWNVYEFDGYRAGMRTADRISRPLTFSFQDKGHDARLACSFDVSTLLGDASGFRLGLAAVIETESGEKSYWALRHPAPQPDFHNREGFQLEFATPPIRN